MPSLVPGIHALATKKDVDGRDKPGHDDVAAAQFPRQINLIRLLRPV
jgi:hypothetical protein